MTLTQQRPRPAIAASPRGGLGPVDAVAALVVAAIVVVIAATIGSWGWPLLGSARVAAVVTAVLGLGVCAAAGSVVPRATGRVYVGVTSALGAAAVVLIVAAAITGSEPLLIGLGAATVSLWIVSTIRHATSRS